MSEYGGRRGVGGIAPDVADPSRERRAHIDEEAVLGEESEPSGGTRPILEEPVGNEPSDRGLEAHQVGYAKPGQSELWHERELDLFTRHELIGGAAPERERVAVDAQTEGEAKLEGVLPGHRRRRRSRVDRNPVASAGADQLEGGHLGFESVGLVSELPRALFEGAESASHQERGGRVIHRPHAHQLGAGGSASKGRVRVGAVVTGRFAKGSVGRDRARTFALGQRQLSEAIVGVEPASGGLAGVAVRLDGPQPRRSGLGHYLAPGPFQHLADEGLDEGISNEERDCARLSRRGVGRLDRHQE